jgi:hypothetical protein
VPPRTKSTGPTPTQPEPTAPDTDHDVGDVGEPTRPTRVDGEAALAAPAPGTVWSDPGSPARAAEEAGLSTAIRHASGKI